MKLCYLLVPMLACLCSGTKFQNCGSSARVTKVEVSDCPDSLNVCKVQRGTVMSISMHFRPTATAEEVNWSLYGKVGEFSLRVPIDKPNACGVGLTCPLDTNQDYVLNGTMKIASWYPPLLVDVKVKLRDERNQTILCIVLKSKITMGPNQETVDTML